ncbi:uncharacterized protein C2orf72 homolog [Mantella aurantiaca]
MARDSTESRFLEVLGRFGGPQHVQLVGELWDRAESRALLEGFLREIFPTEFPLGADIPESKAAQELGGDEYVSRCPGRPEHRAQERDVQTAVITPPIPDRTLCFGLVFFLCRSESLRLRGASRQLREILRDVRERMPAGGAVIGVLMKASSDGNGQELGVVSEDGDGGSAVSALLAMLHKVFPEKSREKLCSEVRACVLIPGHEETRREIQTLACEALTAADELRRLKPKMKFRCFSWRRRKWKDCAEKENIQEGTALTVLQYPNGDCTETMSDV